VENKIREKRLIELYAAAPDLSRKEAQFGVKNRACEQILSLRTAAML
jgi:hypothetical protein